MKTNSTQVVILRIVLFILICLYSILVFGQEPVSLESGISNEMTSTASSLVGEWAGTQK
ncbi:MAG TPA: hypothetical protein PK951_08815 [Chitinophagaceae bacterium]|nr:hypothetical protein [Chitinophagaceae bacterium]